VWQGLDLREEVFGSVARKGLMGRFFESVAKTGLTGRALEQWKERSFGSESSLRARILVGCSLSRLECGVRTQRAGQRWARGRSLAH